MVRSELRITVRSGEMTLSRSTRGPVTWSWILSGVPRPDDEDFIWHGDAVTDDDAFEQIELAWARWVYWSGLESIAPLQGGARRT